MADDTTKNYAEISRERAHLMKQKIEQEDAAEASRQRLEKFLGRKMRPDEGFAAAERELVKRCLMENQLGDARLFAYFNAGRVLHALPSKTWFRWTGHFWEEDRDLTHRDGIASVVAAYHRLTDVVLEEIRTPGLDKEVLREKQALWKVLGKKLFSLCAERHRDAIIRLAIKDLGDLKLAVDEGELDKDLDLLACRNGVIDLRTGGLRPGRPEDLITRHVNVEWQGIDAPASLWERTLSEIFDGQPEVRDFVQRAVGYALLGRPRERKMFIFIGRGANGKTLLEQVLADVLGDLAVTIRSEVLLGRSYGGESATPELFRLKNTRLAFMSEPPKGLKFNEELIKRLTGMDRINARRMYGDAEQFDPTHTFFLAANTLPSSDGTDRAFWSRLLVVEFKSRFLSPREMAETGKAEGVFEIDLARRERLRAEAPGILAWIVRGCLEYQDRGLDPPDAVLRRTQQERDDVDYVGAYFGERVEFRKEEPEKFRIAAADLYQDFEEWFVQNVSKKAPSPNRFARLVKARFPDLERRKISRNMYLGVRFKDPLKGVA